MSSNADGLASSSGGVAIATQIAPDAPGAPPAAKASAEKQGSAQGTPAGSAFDLHPRVAISKGERGDPFMISSQSQREVVQALAWKSMLYIWGSPVFAIVCIYFLLVYWGWL